MKHVISTITALLLPILATAQTSEDIPNPTKLPA